MSDLNKILKEEYDKKKNTITTQSLMEMIEEMMNLQEAFGLVLEEPSSAAAQQAAAQDPGDSIKAYREKERILRRVPVPQFTELGWGTAATVGPDDKVSIPTSADRNALKMYLENIPGLKNDPGNFKAKIDELNGFIKDAATKAKELDIAKSMSFLVFYRTLSMIISNFNAASAGFLFESFLAVLLDAEKGHQVPASGASTIADIIVYPNGKTIPISLKLYDEKTVKVGGSFKQLVDDLIKDGQMDYLVAAKNFVGEKQDKAVDSLDFYYFAFTRGNMPSMLDAVNLDAELLRLPKIFKTQQTYEATPDVDKYLKLPPKSRVNVSDNYSRFKAALKNNLAKEGTKIVRAGHDVNKALGEASREGTYKIGGTPVTITFQFDPEKVNTDTIQTTVENFLANKYDQKEANTQDPEADFKVGRDKNLSSDEKPVFIFTAAGSAQAKTQSGERRFKYDTALRDEIYPLIINDKTVKFKVSGNADMALTKTVQGKVNTILRNQYKAAIRNIIQSAYTDNYPTEESEGNAKSNPRKAKIHKLYGTGEGGEGLSSDESVEVLKRAYNEAYKEQADPNNPEKKIRVAGTADAKKYYEAALKATIGYQLTRQFELTRPKLMKLMKDGKGGARAESGVELPYDTDENGKVASLQIGEDVVYTTVKVVLENINESLNTVFDNLAQLQDNINTYVAGGMNKSKYAEDAEKNADTISEETAKVRKEKSPEGAANNPSRVIPLPQAAE